MVEVVVVSTWCWVGEREKGYCSFGANRSALVEYARWCCAVGRGSGCWSSGAGREVVGEYTVVGRVEEFAVDLAVVLVCVALV